MELRIALLFCLPVLKLGIEWLNGFHEVLIYPGPFIVNDKWQDDIGLVHAGPVVQSGQSWDQGPIILNWQEVQDSFDLSGFNLVINEVTHKLGIRNGGEATVFHRFRYAMWSSGKRSYMQPWKHCKMQSIKLERMPPAWIPMRPRI